MTSIGVNWSAGRAVVEVHEQLFRTILHSVVVVVPSALLVLQVQTRLLLPVPVHEQEPVELSQEHEVPLRGGVWQAVQSAADAAETIEPENSRASVAVNKIFFIRISELTDVY